MPDFSIKVILFAACLWLTMLWYTFRGDGYFASSCTAAEVPAIHSTAPDSDMFRWKELRNVQCPPTPAATRQMADAHLTIVDKYRAFAQKCRTTGGMWRYLSGTFIQTLFSVVFHKQGLAMGAAVLDVGCGCGVALNALRETHAGLVAVVGIDIIPEAVAFAQTQPTAYASVSGSEYNSLSASAASSNKNSKKRRGARSRVFAPRLFCHANASLLGWLPSESFDLVTGWGSFDHIADESFCAFMSEIRRILKPAGTVWAGYLFTPEDARNASSSLANIDRCGRESGLEVVAMERDEVWMARFGIILPRAYEKGHSVWLKKSEASSNRR
jgi:SAM-dependent methyltransferase